MNGPHHYRKAEEYLGGNTRGAVVHAILAAAAAVMATAGVWGGESDAVREQWRDVLEGNDLAEE